MPKKTAISPSLTKIHHKTETQSENPLTDNISLVATKQFKKLSIVMFPLGPELV